MMLVMSRDRFRRPLRRALGHVESAARPPEEYEDEEEGKQSGGQAVHRSVDNRWDGLMAPGGPRGISRS